MTRRLGVILILSATSAVHAQQSSQAKVAHAQADAWQIVGGVGGITGQSIVHRAVFIAAVGRDVATLSRLRLGGELTMAHLPTSDFVCFDICRPPELAYFGALSISGKISASAGGLLPYLRANVGAWIGRDDDVTDNQPSRERGSTIVGEAGIGVQHIALALRLDQLDGARSGTVRIVSIVVRAGF